MRKAVTVFANEYLSCIGRPTAWIVFVVAVAITLIDSLPTHDNLVRLEFLFLPDYFVYRIFSVDGLIMVTGLMIILSNRLSIDDKTGAKSLLMAAPLNKGTYLFGKLSAGFVFSLSMMVFYLTICTVAYAIFIPGGFGISDYIYAALKALVFLGVPVAFFVSMCAGALPTLVDTRIFYLTFFALILLSVVTVGSADEMPFYLITSGDLTKLVWQHPDFYFHNLGSIISNLAFLVGSGTTAALLAFINPRFWRAE